jgi:hypothetical protein
MKLIKVTATKSKGAFRGWQKRGVKKKLMKYFEARYDGGSRGNTVFQLMSGFFDENHDVFDHIYATGAVLGHTGRAWPSGSFMNMKHIYNNTSKLDRVMSNGHHLPIHLGHLPRAHIGPGTLRPSTPFDTPISNVCRYSSEDKNCKQQQ